MEKLVYECEPPYRCCCGGKPLKGKIGNQIFVSCCYCGALKQIITLVYDSADTVILKRLIERSKS